MAKTKAKLANDIKEQEKIAKTIQIELDRQRETITNRQELNNDTASFSEYVLSLSGEGDHFE